MNTVSLSVSLCNPWWLCYDICCNAFWGFNGYLIGIMVMLTGIVCACFSNSAWPIIMCAPDWSRASKEMKYYTVHCIVFADKVFCIYTLSSVLFYLHWSLLYCLLGLDLKVQMSCLHHGKNMWMYLSNPCSLYNPRIITTTVYHN